MPARDWNTGYVLNTPVGRTLATGTAADQVFLVVHRACAPDNDEFKSAFMAMTNHPCRRCLVYARDVPVSAAQRRWSAEYFKQQGRDKRVAVLTDSALVRGIVTALRWLVPSVHLAAFHYTDARAALGWLQIPETLGDEVLRVLKELLEALDKPDKAPQARAKSS